MLLRFVEDCKINLDNNKVGGAILTDLSRAFDCLPHRLLIAKLHAYGVSKNACTLVLNYFYDRKQRVKIGSTYSEWMSILKGAPQRSFFGPFSYNLFTNDLLDMLTDECSLYNYADDNTIAYFANSNEEVKLKLEYVINKMLNWFHENFLQANPDKFQLVTFNRRHDGNVMNVKVGNVMIKAEPTVKLLGVYIDQSLCFNNHISYLCQKAGYKLNVLARLSNNLDFKGKLMLFNSFVISHLMYCPVVWYMCSITDMKKIEKIQKRALRYVTKDYTCPYIQLLDKCDLPTMYVQRMRFIMVEVYTVLNGIGPLYLHDMFDRKESVYIMKNNIELVQPQFRTQKYGFNSIRYQGAKIWNTLPNNIKDASNLSVFKALVKKWSGARCSCNSCDMYKLSMV